MPFQYRLYTKDNSLLKHEIDVEIQVYNNFLSVYFVGGTSAENDYMRNQWICIHEQFLKSVPYYDCYATDTHYDIHNKLAHPINETAELYHIDLQFKRPLNPDIVSNYINQFWSTQHTLSSEFHIITDEGSLDKFLAQYSFYYTNPVCTEADQKIRKDNQLTLEEGRQYLHDLYQTEEQLSESTTVLLPLEDQLKQIRTQHRHSLFYSSSTDSDAEEPTPKLSRLI